MFQAPSLAEDSFLQACWEGRFWDDTLPPQIIGRSLDSCKKRAT